MRGGEVVHPLGPEGFVMEICCGGTCAHTFPLPSAFLEEVDDEYM